MTRIQQRPRGAAKDQQVALIAGACATASASDDEVAGLAYNAVPGQGRTATG